MRQIFLCYIFTILLAACKQNDKTRGDSKETASVIDSNIIGLPVNNVEMEDDSVFADGSRPSSWESAGITNVFALKVFIKDLQYMAAHDNKEEISKLVRYPLNKAIQTKSDFLSNYDQLFTPAVKTALDKVNPRQIFRNYKGVMLGNGNIWIQQFDKDFKIIAINN